MKCWKRGPAKYTLIQNSEESSDKDDRIHLSSDESKVQTVLNFEQLLEFQLNMNFENNDFCIIKFILHKTEEIKYSMEKTDSHSQEVTGVPYCQDATFYSMSRTTSALY